MIEIYGTRKKGPRTQSEWMQSMELRKYTQKSGPND